MSRYFTHLWAIGTFDYQKSLGYQNQPFRHVPATEKFEHIDINIGDYIYVLTCKKKKIYLIGRLQVDKICNQEEAEILCQTKDLYEATNHFVSIFEPYSLEQYDDGCVIPMEVIKRLRFLNGTEEPSYKKNGDFEPQTFRSVRELTPKSALEFDKYLKFSLGRNKI
jgi:hypothetical protein